MDYDFQTQLPEKRGPNMWRRLAILGGLAFVTGIVLMGWAVARWEPARKFLLGSQSVAAADPGARLDEASGLPPAAAPAVIATDGDSAPATASDKVEELEQRLEEIDRTADAASGNAGRAEALLVAFAARRAIDRGLALGYLEAALQQRFGATQPRAVNIIINASRRPVTAEGLGLRLNQLGPLLVGRGGDGNWWESLKSGFSNLVVVRQSGAPSPVPAERLARAALLVEAGRVDAAMAEVARLPGARHGAKWLAEARLYVDSHRALDMLEASAIMATSQPAARPQSQSQSQPQSQSLVPPLASDSL